MENKLIVIPAPHITKPKSTNFLMFAMMVALVPTAISGIINSGIRSLFIILISVGCCYLFEALLRFSKEGKFVWNDFSSIVTGLVLALILPVNVSLYIPVIGALLAVVIFKGCFGGIGRNIFNPAAAARVILGLMFTGLTLDLFEGTSLTLGANVASPLYYYAMGDLSNITLRSLFFGTATGAIGTVSIICVLIAGILLMSFKITDFAIPVCAIITFIITIWVGEGAKAIIPYIFSGSFLFACMFMVPDPTTSPNTIWAKLFYGLLFGFFAGILRVKFILGETSVFIAVLAVNLLSGLLDKIFAPHPIGLKRRV